MNFSRNKWKSWSTVIGVVLISLNGYSHTEASFDTVAIIKRSKHAPKKHAKNLEALALYLTDGLVEDNEKVYAFTIWITHNIKYNHSALSTRDQYHI